jgi:zinc transport system permease protein
MTEPALFLDPLFRVPFLTGLLLAGALPVLGALLLLRDEWLAALGLAHLAAAAALLGFAFGLPLVLGGSAGALVGATGKSLFRARGNRVYGFMILGGWSSLLLVAANTALGDGLSHALIDGQLYFAGLAELAAAAALAATAAVSLPWLMPRLLRAHFFPRHESANRLPAWRWHLGFDLLAALGMAVGTATLGLMGAFALVLVPAWIAFRAAPSWGSALAIAAASGTLGYLVAFVLALGLDQPFGPVLVAVLLIGATVVGAWGNTGTQSADAGPPADDETNVSGPDPRTSG